MRTPRLLAAAAAAGVMGLTAGGPALAQDRHKPQSQCFLSSNVENFSAPDNRTVFLRVGVKDIWRLDLMNDCLDLPFRQHIGFESAGGDPWICTPIQATVVAHVSGIAHRCPVSGMHHLTPDEVASLPKRVRP